MSCKARLLSPRIESQLKKAKIFCCGNPNIGWPYTDAHKTSYKYHAYTQQLRGHFFSSSDWEDIKEYSLVLVNLRQKYAMKN